MEDLQDFVSVPVEVAILDEHGGEKAPFVKKTIKRLGLCPDQTHLRIYFDDVYFLAVPLDSKVRKTNLEWSAIDAGGNLHYKIRKVRENE